MAKDMFLALGNGELSGLMAVQADKLSKACGRLDKLLEENKCKNMAEAYENHQVTDEKEKAFIEKRNALIKDISEIISVMEGINNAQLRLLK